MKYLIAPDKFKGSLTAIEACQAIEKGILNFDPSAEIILQPLADGGEGSIDVLKSVLDLKKEWSVVNDPLFRPIETVYYKKGTTAFIEMASASGLGLLKKEEQNCLYTSTYGTGELILQAINNGAKDIYLFIGGSATNDAGIGMAAALGYRILDVSGKIVKPIGKNLINIHTIDNSELKIDLRDVKVKVVSDVDNVLYGLEGAAFIYAPQKGANDTAVLLLDAGLRHFSKIIKRDLGKTMANAPGAGAAGGMGAGALSFLNATLLPGCETIMQLIDFESKIKWADLVITGEGKLDQQTLQGKVVKAVSKACKKMGLPLIVACGVSNLSIQKLQELGIKHCIQLVSENVTPKMAMQNAAQLLEEKVNEMLINIDLE